MNQVTSLGEISMLVVPNSLPSMTFCSHTAHFSGHRSIDPSSTTPAQALVLLGVDFDTEAEFAGVGEVVVFAAVLPCFAFFAAGISSQQLFSPLGSQLLSSCAQGANPPVVSSGGDSMPPTGLCSEMHTFLPGARRGRKRSSETSSSADHWRHRSLSSSLELLERVAQSTCPPCAGRPGSRGR